MRSRNLLIPFFYFIAVALYFLAGKLASAQTSPIAELAKTPAWQALLHRHHSENSKVISKGFFFADQGRGDAVAELAATISAFQSEQNLNQVNEHPQCRFPARKMFLMQHGYQFPLVTCPDYQEWRQGIQAQSLSLVYAAAYNENAASMFGHTFLRINPFPAQQKEIARDKLLGYTVGFLANVDPNDNSFAYAFKGITGQYPGVFQIDPYYVTTAIYGSSESRDLWEYDLNLSQSELNLLVAHLWELHHHAAFDYFFFDENCSLYLLSFLQVARPEQDLLKNFGAVVLPLTTVRVLGAQGWLQTGAVHRPSLEKKLRQRYEALNTSQRKQFKALVNDSRPGLIPDASSAEALLLYYDFKKQEQKGNLPELDRLKLQDLRTQLSKTKTPAELQPRAMLSARELRPDQAPENPQWSLAYKSADAKNSKRDHHFNLGFRAGIHGLSDLDQAYEPWSEVRVLDGNLLVPIEKPRLVYLKNLDLVSVTSLTPLSFWQKDWSWHLGLGSEYQDLAYRLHPFSQTLVASAAGGFSWQNLSRQFLISFLPKLRMEQQTYADHKTKLWASVWVLLGWQRQNFKTLSSLDYAIEATGQSCHKRSWLQSFAWGMNRSERAWWNKAEFFLNAEWKELRNLSQNSNCEPSFQNKEVTLGMKVAS